VIDASHGQVEVTSATGLKNGRASARLSAGMFRVRQLRARSHVKSPVATNLELVTAKGADRPCRRTPPGKGVVRALTVVAKGVISTTAGAAVITSGSATASWTAQDRCDGTLVRSLSGTVTITPIKGQRTISLKAGSKRLVKAKLFAARQNR
jgi:hypothetical protein